jgi:CheY-like chemotaxis protein
MDTDYSTWCVLAVDDEPDNLDLIADLLEFQGASVERAADAQHGLDLLEVFEPNLILLDLAMPGMDGWELHRKLRLRPKLASVPIIALTALAMQSDKEKVLAAGFDGYVTKPFRVAALLKELADCMEAFNHKHSKPQRAAASRKRVND